MSIPQVSVAGNAGICSKFRVGTNNINKNTPHFKGEIPKLTTFSEKWSKRIRDMGLLSSPANRFIIGAVAISTQPWIDLYNRDVDKETQKTSCLRTIAKIVIGTGTGVAVRYGCIWAMDNFTRTVGEMKDIKNKGLATALIPSTEIISHEDFSKATRLLKKHRQALGSFIAIVVMMATDPPLTVFLTNFFNKQRKQLEAKKAALKGGN